MGPSLGEWEGVQLCIQLGDEGEAPVNQVLTKPKEPGEDQEVRGSPAGEGNGSYFAVIQKLGCEGGTAARSWR